MSENTPAETPKQIEIHTVIMVLDLAGRVAQVFARGKPFHMVTLRNMLHNVHVLEQSTRAQPDLKLRMEMNQAALAHTKAAAAFKDLLAEVEIMGVIGSGNINPLRDGIQALQKECGCERCMKDHDANLLTRLAEPVAPPARFTGPMDKWVQRILDEQKARTEAQAAPRIIQP